MQKLPKCRKSIRKKRRLLISYKMRNQKCKWLPTHLWSVKRMRMIDYYGTKIAYTPNDKSFRSAYRHFRHNTCLMDFTYLRCLTIWLKGDRLPESIKIKSNNGVKFIQSVSEITTK